MGALDRFLPDYHFSERHATHIRAPAAVVYRAIRDVTVAEMPLVGALFWLRALPARLFGHRYRFANRLRDTRDPTSVLRTTLAGGFIVLHDHPEHEIALGTVGRFWQLSASGARVPDAAAFHSFSDPTYAKATLDFRLEPSPDGATTYLSTETRISTPDPATRRRFGLYWRDIYPGSALIRVAWLRAIRRRAEHAAHSQHPSQAPSQPL